MEDLDRYGVIGNSLRSSLFRQPCQSHKMRRLTLRLSRRVWRRRRRFGELLLAGESIEQDCGRLASACVERKAKLGADAGVDDFDCSVGVVAVDEKVGSLRGAAGDAEAVLGCVDDGDDFEAC